MYSGTTIINVDIIAEYELSYNTSDDSFLCFSVRNTGPAAICPECQCSLRHRDWRPRICKREGGEKSWIKVERGKCPSCGRLHTILPDKLVPYKQYEADVISGVLDGAVTPDDIDSEDYPCAETMRRWILWFALNLERIEGYLRNAILLRILYGYAAPDAPGNLLQSLRKTNDRWLETALRIITNTGGRLAAVY